MSYGLDFSRCMARSPAIYRSSFSRVKSLPTCRSSRRRKHELIINLKTAKALGLETAADAARPRR